MKRIDLAIPLNSFIVSRIELRLDKKQHTPEQIRKEVEGNV